jgi:hypothetical protein
MLAIFGSFDVSENDKTPLSARTNRSRGKSPYNGAPKSTFGPLIQTS